MTDAAIAAALGRSSNAIGIRRQRITQRLRKACLRRWTAKEDALLVELYGKVDTLFLAALLARPIA